MCIRDSYRYRYQGTPNMGIFRMQDRRILMEPITDILHPHLRYMLWGMGDPITCLYGV